MCRDLKIKPPEVCFTEREFCKGVKVGDMHKYPDNAGYMMSDPRRMFIRRDNCLVHSIEAVAHELVHFKYPQLRHGKKFQEIVETILHAKIPRVKLAKRYK